ncbi:hypothetical protein M5K25_018448 [Dendrobium thyrsiflorum]|uniref:FLZ-type domain-containing protein n=1 Tax=Dendrobium thyrsiflorum TaxID=117978 RepID=A0ABD0UI13_DENTH
MLLGKRPRPPMSRTISMAEFAADLELADDSPLSSDQNISATVAINPHQQLQHLESKQRWWPGDFPVECRQRNYKWASSAAATMIQPQGPRRNSADFAAAVETAPFLRSCGLCKHSLNLGRDIFMYRGEIAFCSLECRQQLMNQEDRMKNSAPATTTFSEPSGSGETVAAA